MGIALSLQLTLSNYRGVQIAAKKGLKVIAVDKYVFDAR